MPELQPFDVTSGSSHSAQDQARAGRLSALAALIARPIAASLEHCAKKWEPVFRVSNALSFWN
jgi:hypothetical protein